MNTPIQLTQPTSPRNTKGSNNSTKPLQESSHHSSQSIHGPWTTDINQIPTWMAAFANPTSGCQHISQQIVPILQAATQRHAVLLKLLAHTLQTCPPSYSNNCKAYSQTCSQPKSLSTAMARAYQYITATWTAKPTTHHSTLQSLKLNRRLDGFNSCKDAMLCHECKWLSNKELMAPFSMPKSCSYVGSMFLTAGWCIIMPSMTVPNHLVALHHGTAYFPQSIATPRHTSNHMHSDNRHLPCPTYQKHLILGTMQCNAHLWPCYSCFHSS